MSPPTTIRAAEGEVRRNCHALPALSFVQLPSIEVQAIRRALRRRAVVPPPMPPLQQPVLPTRRMAVIARATATGAPKVVRNARYHRSKNSGITAAVFIEIRLIWRKWAEPGSNRRHMDFQSIALPAELSARMPIALVDRGRHLKGVRVLCKFKSTDFNSPQKSDAKSDERLRVSARFRRSSSSTSRATQFLQLPRVWASTSTAFAVGVDKFSAEPGLWTGRRRGDGIGGVVG